MNSCRESGYMCVGECQLYIDERKKALGAITQQQAIGMANELRRVWQLRAEDPMTKPKLVKMCEEQMMKYAAMASKYDDLEARTGSTKEFEPASG